MHPILDSDALVLLATTLSAKRRPAELVEIIAAAELIAGSLPGEAKLAESIENLSRHGLICARDGGLALTAGAEALMATQPRKGTGEERLFHVRDDLSACPTRADHAPVQVTPAELQAAIAAHRASSEGSRKNLLVPKPKAPDSERQRPGQRQRKPLPASKRKR